MNKVNTNDTLNRMKSLMNYGLKTESKQAPYSALEYQKVGADGKVYGIVREGTKYYIKSAPNKPNLVKENFDYIGGFRNRKENEYTSYANAQKNFDMKMMSLKEAANKKDFNVESWDLNKKETVVVEATDKMKKEILRERQIMNNAKKIAEAKKECVGGICDKDIKNSQKPNISSEVEECGDAASANAGYTNASVPASMTEGETCPKCGKNPCQCETVNEEEVLGWNRGNDDYMDKSHGTEIGDSAPFDDKEARNIDDGDKKVSQTGEMKNGVVENHGTSMHDADNQNSPAVGVGEGPSDDNNKPFDDKKGKQIDGKKVNEAIDDFGPDDAEGGDDLGGGDGLGAEGGDDLGGEGLDAAGEGDFEGGDDFGGEDEFGAEGDDEFGDEELGDDLADDDVEGEDMYEDDVESRLDAMEDLLSQIADKLGVSAPAVDDEAYGDDDLFGDEEGDEFGDEDDFEGGDDFGGEDDFGAEGGDDLADGDDFEDEDEMPMENRRRRGVQIYETKAFRRAMRNQRINEDGMTPFKDAGRVPSGNMNKLDDFGKHPAYQKKVMELPPKDLQEFPGYYDMNDDSVRNDNPYGEKIGDGAPFDIDPQSIDNAIAEAFNRLKKKQKVNEVFFEKRPTKLEIPNSDLGGDMDGMGDLDNAPMPPMGPDDDMGMNDPMGGEDPNAMGDEPPMDGPDDMGGEDPMGGDEPPMDRPDDMGGGSDDDELMNIVDGMSTEDKAAVIKYAKSMVDNSEPMGDDDMPMESFRNYKGIIDEVINDVIDNQDGTKRPSKKLPKEYKGMKSPFKSPY